MSAVLTAAPVDDDEPPTWMEKVGVTANARNLVVDEQRRPVDTVIGLGMALAGLKRNPGKRPELAELEHQLVPSLWKMKAGEQGRYTAASVRLFTEWMIEKKRFTESERAMVHLFALRVVYEWLHEICMECGGAGVQERSGHKVVRPRGLMARNPRYFSCELCKGSRRALPKHGERCQALGISMKRYDKEGWFRKFTLALVSLDAIARRLNRPLALRFRQE